MATYLSTFVVGLGEPVRCALEESISVQIELELDGAIVYKTAVGLDAICKLPFFNNSFLVLENFADLRLGRDKEVLREMLTRTLRSPEALRSLPARVRGTFRIVTAWSNQLVAIDNSLLEQLERKIAASGRLRPHRGRPDHELWLSYRSEGYGFFLLRLTSHAAYDKVLQRGELRPELAYMLCWLSEPREGELVLDPFSGSGAIPLMCASRFPQGLVLASDKDKLKMERLRSRIKKSELRKSIVVREGDARNLSRYKDDSIHKIITDPPWGNFEELDTEPKAFYSAMLAEFCRILRPGGIVVILMARMELFSLVLESFSGCLSLVQSYPILVSGKKAIIYKLRKLAA